MTTYKKTFRAKYMRLAYQIFHNYSAKYRKDRKVSTWGDAIRYAMNEVQKINQNVATIQVISSPVIRKKPATQQFLKF
jgi:hypothetical protein